MAYWKILIWILACLLEPAPSKRKYRVEVGAQRAEHSRAKITQQQWPSPILVGQCKKPNDFGGSKQEQLCGWRRRDKSQESYGVDSELEQGVAAGHEIVGERTLCERIGMEGMSFVDANWNGRRTIRHRGKTKGTEWNGV